MTSLAASFEAFPKSPSGFFERNHFRGEDYISPRKLFLSSALRTVSSPKPRSQLNHLRNWLRGKDLNLRPSGYEPDELPDCSTPRLRSSLHHHSLCITALPLHRFVCRAVCSAKKEIMSELFYPCNPTHPKKPQSPRFFAHLLSIHRPLFKQLHPLTRSNTQPADIIEKFSGKLQNA